jgi:hypothetical protein
LKNTYREFSYNIGGLITLEYAPFWLIAGLATERVIIGRLEYLRWSYKEPAISNGVGSGHDGGTKIK